MKAMDVDQSTINWVKILYNNIKSIIKVNGALTAEIIIKRGITNYRTIGYFNANTMTARY